MVDVSIHDTFSLFFSFSSFVTIVIDGALLLPGTTRVLVPSS